MIFTSPPLSLQVRDQVLQYRVGCGVYLGAARYGLVGFGLVHCCMFWHSVVWHFVAWYAVAARYGMVWCGIVCKCRYCTGVVWYASVVCRCSLARQREEATCAATVSENIAYFTLSPTCPLPTRLPIFNQQSTKFCTSAF